MAPAVRSGLFQFRRFGARLLALLLGLLVAVLATISALVWRASDATARDHATRSLETAAGIFDDTIRQRIDALATSAGLMTADYTIKQFFTRAERPDIETLSSILPSLADRVHSAVVLLLSNDEDRTLIGNSDAEMNVENLGPFRQLSREAAESANPVAHGFSYFKGEFSVLVVIPLYAPRPQVAAWVGLTFPIDGEFADNLKRTTGIDVTFVATEEGSQPHVLVSTLAASATPTVAAAAQASGRAIGSAILELPDDRYVTLFKRQALLGENPINIVLQRPLSPELTAARALQKYLLGISLAAFVAATACAFWIARDVSRPVLALAAHTKHVAAGDYARRLDLQRVDELGQLATAFNAMSAGLAERDRVRDLLDKNVSPEVAAQLLRDGAALGGEEREVTILFADLRGFTTLSEKLAPRDLLQLLNRYLDRMSAAIEAHGGVIDKFIGDEIMALFGAPVAQGDAAGRALAAALAMERALAELNRELARENTAPFALGIGVNTARVVAGNIGSHRRLNYSVIGDGVNVAARLQTLTRTAEFRTNIITSAATVAACRASAAIGSEIKSPAFRSLGSVQVKGRAEPVEIFAVG